MSSVILQYWLNDFNRQMKRANRKVILLVDNAASRSVGEVQPTNETLYYLPPKSTSNIQPIDAGIIQAFNVQYMKQLIRKFISCAEDDQPQTINLREALYMVKTAWASVTGTTITNYTTITCITNYTVSVS